MARAAGTAVVRFLSYRYARNIHPLERTRDGVEVEDEFAVVAEERLRQEVGGLVVRRTGRRGRRRFLLLQCGLGTEGTCMLVEKSI